VTSPKKQRQAKPANEGRAIDGQVGKDAPDGTNAPPAQAPRPAPGARAALTKRAFAARGFAARMGKGAKDAARGTQKRGASAWPVARPRPAALRLTPEQQTQAIAEHLKAHPKPATPMPTSDEAIRQVRDKWNAEHPGKPLPALRERKTASEAKPPPVGSEARDGENGPQASSGAAPVAKDGQDDTKATPAGQGRPSEPVETLDGIAEARRVPLRSWEGDFMPDVERLRQLPADHNLTWLKNHLVGRAIEKHTSHTVEELLDTYMLSFGGVAFFNGWQAMQVKTGKNWEDMQVKTGEDDVSVEVKHEEILRLLLALAWVCSLPWPRDDETEHVVSTVSTAIKAFRAAHELRSKGGKKPRRTSSGNETRAQLKRYWDECTGNQASRVRYCFHKMKASGNQKTERRIREIAHNEGWPTRKQGT
jgi:hypothetical protein